MFQKQSAQETRNDLETLLKGIQTGYYKAAEINDEEGSERASEYLYGALTQSKTDELSHKIFDYMSEVDNQTKIFNNQISDLFLKRNYDVESVQRELKIVFLKEDGKKEERFRPVSGYVSDNDLYFENRDTSPIQDLVPSIDQIKESHNYSFYRTARGDKEFEFRSRVKKYVTEKFLRYIFKESDFPRDFGGNRLIFQRSRHLYMARDMVREMASSIIEEDYRNLPEEHDDNAVWSSIELARGIGRENESPTNEQKKKMKVGIWIDFFI